LLYRVITPRKRSGRGGCEKNKRKRPSIMKKSPLLVVGNKSKISFNETEPKLSRKGVDTSKNGSIKRKLGRDCGRKGEAEGGDVLHNLDTCLGGS